MPDWPAIVSEFGPLVWRTAYRLLGHHADAADCFQRTFLGAVEFAAAESVRNWPGLLRRLATARALERLRELARQGGRREPMPEALPIDEKSADPFALTTAGELAGRLREALAEIDPVQAQVFCLIGLEDLSYREAAEQLGITPNHAGVLLNRARAALRDRLRAFDPANNEGHR